MYPKEYIEFLIHYHGDRDYFECHEILEEYWKRVEPNNKQSIWVGLILLAVSNYHHRRENDRGAKKTLSKSIFILKKEKAKLQDLGLDSEKFLTDLLMMQADISSGRKYSSFTLPIVDQSLISLCKERCLHHGFEWCTDSDLERTELVHRHSLRDRSMVIQERLEALNKSTWMQ